MALTGYRDGPPLLAPGAPASAVRGALAVFDLLTQLRRSSPPPSTRPSTLPDMRLLGERAALAGLHRNAPWSVGGAFRCIRATDGWLGLSLPRDDDHALVPALVSARSVTDSWHAVAQWAADIRACDAVERAQVLGLAAAVIPIGHETPHPPVTSHRGGPSKRARPQPPVVVDLSALWAGPLCASLLHASGARVIKVESDNRLDGARRGSAAFFDLLNGGHESVVLDFASTSGRADLHHLIDEADVVIESARPRALRQLGIHAEDHVGGGTTWVSITGYGRDSAWANRVAFGDDAAAAAGLVAWTPDGPVPCGDAIADPLAGVHGAAAVAAALTDDHAHLLDLSMRDVAAAAARLPVEPADVVAEETRWVVQAAAATAVVAEPHARTRPEC
jgi:hypothetical protein